MFFKIRGAQLNTIDALSAMLDALTTATSPDSEDVLLWLGSPPTWQVGRLPSFENYSANLAIGSPPLRVANTNYVNTSGRPKAVSIIVRDAVLSSVFINGVKLTEFDSPGIVTHSVIVPHNHACRLAILGSPLGVIDSWRETI